MIGEVNVEVELVALTKQQAGSFLAFFFGGNVWRLNQRGRSTNDLAEPTTGAVNIEALHLRINVANSGIPNRIRTGVVLP